MGNDSLTKDSASKDSVSKESLSKDSIDRLCADCGETFSEFLQEMAEQNAKVATCPKCGKIHEFPKPNTAKTTPRGRSVKKAI
jgi:DNA-directed RNA polymerase subunit RPC12/RpoP